MFREEATSAFAGFHAGPLSWSNGNLEMWGFCGARKTGEPSEKPSERGRTINELHPHVAPGRNRTQATMVKGELSHHCVIPTSPLSSYFADSTDRVTDS